MIKYIKIHSSFFFNINVFSWDFIDFKNKKIQLMLENHLSNKKTVANITNKNKKNNKTQIDR